MNYIELINNFWQLDKNWAFSCCETRLYFYLLETANCLGWEDRFWHTDDKVSGNVGASKNTIKTAKNRLIQANLIKVETGGSGYGDKTRYQILTPKVHPKLYPKVHPKLDAKLPPLNKPNQTNNSFNKELNTKIFSKEDFKQKLLDVGVEQKFIDDWVVVRDKKKAVYTESALNLILNECEKNNFSTNEAVKICAERGWQSFKYNWITENNKNGTHKQSFADEQADRVIDNIKRVHQYATAGESGREGQADFKLEI